VTLTSSLVRVLATAASVAALAALWRYRPEWPNLPDSLSSPVTTTLLQQLAVIAAWLLATLLVLLLLARNFTRRRARRILEPSGGLSAATRSHTRAWRIRPVAAHPVGVQARLVVVATDEVARHSPGEDVAAVTPDHDPDPGERPLISLLGPLAIHGAKQSRRGLRARALELIAFLALRREGAQRDEILEALWPGEDPKRSRHRLYQAVRDARRLLGEAVASERDRYWLDRKRVRVDVDDLEELVKGARAFRGSGQQAAAVDGRSREALASALSLFRAEPLAGSDYAWAASEIRRLRATHAALVELVGRTRLEAGEARDALELAERGLTVDVLNEGLWRLALEAEGELGLREAIEARYCQLAALLEERLGLEPAKETRSLYLRLLSQT
jgi:DNA-binding SARP family transcriptional activator